MAKPIRFRKSNLTTALLVWVVLGCLLSSGCVRRRLTVRSNPPGALVYIDDQEIGTTPVSTSFVYYGTRKIRLVLDGYETLTVMQRMRGPWYQWPPLDFVSENVWPQELRDERVLDFQLVPQKIVPTRQLMARATNLRDGSRQGYVAPLPTVPAGDSVRPSAPGRPPGDVYNPSLTFPPPPPPPSSRF